MMIDRLIMLLGLARLLTLTAAAQTDAPPIPAPPTRSIVGNGTAERQVPPDVGLVVFAVVTRKTTVSRAVSENNALAHQVMDALRKLDLHNLQLRTPGFEVTPIYEHPSANQVDSMSFLLENDMAVQREVLAAAAGVHLGPLLILSPAPFYRQPPTPVFAHAMEAARGPMAAGPLTVQVSVSATYGIR